MLEARVDASAEPTERPPLPGLRPPRQARSRETLDRIADAALGLIAEKGVEGASVQEIVDRAGSSVGSFYARFDGKGDLVRYLEHRVWGDARERWDAGVESGAWTDAELPRVVEGLVGLLLRVERTDTAGRRALSSRAGGAGSGIVPSGPGDSGATGSGPEEPGRADSDSEGAAWTGERFLRHIAADVRALLSARRAEVAHPDPELAADVLLRILVGAVRELAPLHRDDVVVRELTRAALAYLGGGPDVDAGEPDPGAMDFFDVWG